MKLTRIIFEGNQLVLKSDTGKSFPAVPTGHDVWRVAPITLGAGTADPDPDPGDGGGDPGEGTPTPGGNEWQWPFQYSRWVIQTGPIAPLTQFGMRLNPVSHKYVMHQGLDFGAGGINGQPIPSAHDGIVEMSASPSAPYYGYGAAILIRHPDGTACLYAHRPQKELNVGDQVKRGQIIGHVGATGNVTGPHLHFETWEKGNVKVDPRKFMAARGVKET
jgi:murein DD-endopeptidase MepM/ murein hydrolase activator NlpD